MQVFVSHAPSDRDAAAALRADLAQLGRQVALDRGEPNGARWWETVLQRVQRCDVFVLVASPAAMRSPGCVATAKYAASLDRPVLVISAADVALPAELASAPVFTPGGLSITERIPQLRGVLLKLPAAPPLPEPLPPQPVVPYIEQLRERLEEPELAPEESRELLRQLRLRLRDEGERAAAWSLLVRMRTRPDLPAPVATEIEKVLAPGWQPDPERRVEKRYWDGMAWTTLVRHEGREFSERRVPPPEATWSGESAPAKPGRSRAAQTATPRPAAAPKPQRDPGSAPDRGRMLLIGGVSVVVVGAAVAAFTLVGGKSTSDPTSAARAFVDAVNVSDVDALGDVTCERDRARASTLFLGVQLTLERVDDAADPPTFTVLASDPGGLGGDRRTYSLVKESGSWLVCRG
ncbi:TIR domain-containing protein [Actinokineospora auranticolor]|uniref:Uncharacterized protein DUF2510 n=1 Tax=Actinokineospora auranticolor TaxID=155976 RepID=A0A2S6GNV1_9PSEU|nr:TIR domain-containing protein [Actinokineospora auranticolor]PPK66843.1 uncharacterized protein DUF2510 [Actinokineospora auranticolor]